MRQDQKNSTPLITATAQQSRFHSATFDAGANLDLELRDVTLTIGGLDALEGADIVLRSGVRYGLTGRNGCGKSSESTLFSVGTIQWLTRTSSPPGAG